MRESKFISKKTEQWKALEKVLEAEKKEPNELKDLFVKVTDDLAYAQTFYPNRMIKVYLNTLGKKVFDQLSKTRKLGLQSFLQFWKVTLPLEFYKSRRSFLFSFLIFTISILVGVFSTLVDPDFPRLILGDGYVDMTIANIEKGDPMYVYKDSEAFGMTLGITSNNLLVSFYTYFFGIFAGLGSFVILFRNGVMVGAFQFMFYQYGLLQESFLTIFMHGAIELSCIVIAGAAGLTMGSGILYPKTYTRAQSFKLSAKRGFRMMIGITPFIIMAGIIESYLTRQTEIPDALRLFFILACFALIIGYFVLYPRWVAKNNESLLDEPEKVLPTNIPAFKKGHIYSFSQIFEISLAGILRIFGKVVLIGAIFSALLLGLKKLLLSPGQLLFFNPGSLFFSWSISHFFAVLAVFWLFILLVQDQIQKDLGFKKPVFQKRYLFVLFPIAIFICLFSLSEYLLLLLLVLCPFIFSWIAVIFESEESLATTFMESLKQVFVYSIQAGMIGAIILLFFFLSFGIVYSATGIFLRDVLVVIGLSSYYHEALMFIQSLQILTFVTLFMYTSFIFSYSIKEVVYAENLIDSISKFRNNEV